MVTGFLILILVQYGGPSVSTMLLRSSYKQCYAFNMMRPWDSKGSENLLRISYVSLKTHTLGGSLLPYRFVVNSLLYDSYRMGGASTSTSLKSQLVQVVIPPQHDAFAEINQPAGLSSIHSPSLDKV